MTNAARAAAGIVAAPPSPFPQHCADRPGSSLRHIAAGAYLRETSALRLMGPAGMTADVLDALGRADEANALQASGQQPKHGCAPSFLSHGR